jgi:predicted transcriptional regulator
MPRPAAPELTQRELEVMHVFWNHGELTAAEARDRLEASGRTLTYTTVATLVRILFDKGFLRQTTAERPFVYAATRSHAEVSRSLLGDVVQRVFAGSREQLLMRLLETRPLNRRERAFLESLLEEEPS